MAAPATVTWKRETSGKDDASMYTKDNLIDIESKSAV
jgi:hypothetical protein